MCAMTLTCLKSNAQNVSDDVTHVTSSPIASVGLRALGFYSILVNE